MNLAGTDLNLLVAFDALMSELSVTRAGKKIGLSQPAMSGVLARLRHQLGDDLFIRRGDRMLPTRKAVEIAEPIRMALDQIRAALSENTYVSAISRRTFRLACNDVGAAVLVPSLIERLAVLAPNVNVIVNHADAESAADQLRRGEIDLAAGHHPERAHNLTVETLYKVPYACAVRAGHPFAGKVIDFADFAGLAHVLVTHSGIPERRLDQLFCERKLSRRIALHVPHYLAVPHVLHRTDFVAFVPRKIIQQSGNLTELSVSDASLESLHASTVLFWNSNRKTDEGNDWLRSIFIDVCRDGGLEDRIA